MAILSVCCALSAFCLMLETISSIEEEASSAEAACALAPFDTWTEAALMAWLAEPTSPAMLRISVTVRVRPPPWRSGPASVCPAADRSWTATVRLPCAISSAAWVTSFMAPISEFRLFLMVLNSPW